MSKERINISLEVFNEIKRVVQIMWKENNTNQHGSSDYRFLSRYTTCSTASLENYNRLIEILRKY